MNCETCTSRKVCFLQNQIKSLADRMIQPPFNEVIDTGGDRTKAMLQRHEKAMIKQNEICRKLKGVIASSCLLYSGKLKSKTDYEAIKINEEIQQLVKKEFSELALEVKFDLEHPELHGIECRPGCAGTIHGASWKRRNNQQRKDFIKSKLVQALSSIRDMINNTIINFGVYQDPPEDDKDRKIWDKYSKNNK